MKKQRERLLVQVVSVSIASGCGALIQQDGVLQAVGALALWLLGLGMGVYFERSTR